VTIEASGEVLQGGRTVGVIQLALPPDRLRPVRGGDGLLRLEGGAARHPAPGTLVQGHLESSAVDAVSSLDELIDATRAAQANLRLMQHHDHIMGQAINTVGRIA
jgi:flagellar basal body rod protein FlgG